MALCYRPADVAAQVPGESPAMANILVTGARGMLGRRLVEALSVGHRVTAATRGGRDGTLALDITSEDDVRDAVTSLRPEWIVNAAAYTATDRAEQEPELAWAANARGPLYLARAARNSGARILHIGTDFVFSGSKGSPYVETDAMGPRGDYASSKAAGEQTVRPAAPDHHSIVRVSWLYGKDGPNFVATMLRLAKERDTLRVVSDQRGTPTLTTDAAHMIVRILENGISGTIHAANQGVTTWFDLAERTIKLAGLPTRVIPITTAEYPTPCPRPACSALTNQVLGTTLGDSMRPWPSALADYLHEIGVHS